MKGCHLEAHLMANVVQGPIALISLELFKLFLWSFLDVWAPSPPMMECGGYQGTGLSFPDVCEHCQSAWTHISAWFQSNLQALVRRKCLRQALSRK